MRDPDLMGRAQRAATELERAWDRWRTLHGISREPMPAVSSYVGYSMEEPWGQPRVVFGIEAREAEELAALLDHHDSAGPVYAGMTSMPAGRAEQPPELLAGTQDRGVGGVGGVGGRLVVPTQAQATVAEREAAWREATWREATAPEPDSEPEPLRPSPWEAAVAETETEADAELEARDSQRGEPGRAGRAALAPSASESLPPDGGDSPGDEAGPAGEEDPGRSAEMGQAGGWSRSGRGSGGHSLQRPRRGGSRGAGRQSQE